jgi:hypothetical protein
MNSAAQRHLLVKLMTLLQDEPVLSFLNRDINIFEFYLILLEKILLGTKYFGRHSAVTSKQINVNQALTSSR